MYAMKACTASVCCTARGLPGADVWHDEVLLGNTAEVSALPLLAITGIDSCTATWTLAGLAAFDGTSGASALFSSVLPPSALSASLWSREVSSAAYTSKQLRRLPGQWM